MRDQQDRQKIMSQKKIKFNLLLIAMIPTVHELWQLWKHDMRIINPWLALDYPYSIQWFMKDIGEKTSLLVLHILVYRLTRMNNQLWFASKVVLWFQVADIVFYFINFNRFNYVLIYLLATPLTLAFALYKDDISLWITRKRYASRRKFIRWKLKADLWLRNRKQKSVPVETKISKRQTVEA